MKPKTLVLVGALAFSACTPSGSSTTTAGVTTSTSQAAPTTTTGESTTTTLPTGTEELPEALRAEIARLIGITEDLRGHEFTTPPDITVLTSAELAARVREQIEESYEDVEVDQALYVLLGLVEPDFDLEQTIADLYSEQVAGFYDGETGELVVPARNNEFTILQEVTLVHELTHALTDQALDFHEHFSTLNDEDRFDEASAYQALIEGDASLTEILFVQQMNPADQQQFLEEALQGVDDTVFAGVPQFIQDSLLFPYESGFFFVSELFEGGGFDRIDQAYAEPPLSTEQVLDPSRFPDDPPIEVADVPAAIEGYELGYGSTWGELGFRLIFDQALGGRDAATEGWGGDRYNVFFDGTEAAMALRYVGDSENDAVELAGALNEYVLEMMNAGDGSSNGSATTYQGDDYAFVSRVGDEVVWLIAGDPAVGADLRAQFPAF